MNRWAPREDTDGQTTDTRSREIVLFRANPRFIYQYLLVVCCLSLPLVGLLISSQPVDWLLMPIALLTAYGTSFWLVPMGLHWPLLFALIYWANPTLYTQALRQAIAILPPLPQLGMGLAVGTIGLIITSLDLEQALIEAGVI